MSDLIGRDELHQQINQKDPQEVQKTLDEMVVGTELTSEYLELEEGETMRCIYLGMTTFKTQNEGENPTVRDAVKVWVNGQTYITASSVLVNSLRDEEEITPIEVTHAGKKKVKGGQEYVNFKVSKIFPPKKSK